MLVGWLIRNQYENLQSSSADDRLARPLAHTLRTQRYVQKSTARKAAELPLPATTSSLLASRLITTRALTVARTRADGGSDAR